MPIACGRSIPPKRSLTGGRAGVIGLVWAANTEDDIAEYVVEISASAGGLFSEVGRIDAGGRRGFKQEALPPSLTRYYRVQAIDVDGLRGTWSESVEGFTKPRPDAPTDLEDRPHTGRYHSISNSEQAVHGTGRTCGQRGSGIFLPDGGPGQKEGHNGNRRG